MSIKSELLKNSVAFSMSFRRWGNLRRANKDEIQTGADKAMMRVSKKLVSSAEYDSIVKLQNRSRRWVEDNSVPSFFHRGVYLIATNSVERVERYLEKARTAMDGMVDEFITTYREQIVDARELLGPQFNQNDYPSPDYLKNRFSIDWKYMAFDVPDNLSEEMFRAEKKKAERVWAEATDSIKNCLRESFLTLINRATDKLVVQPGEKPKVFRDSLMNNIQEFFDTFSNRNIVNDTELGELVTKARSILVDPKLLRKDVSVRANVADQFDKVGKALSSMIIVKPSRKFDFDN
jgi:hypothetical protein